MLNASTSSSAPAYAHAPVAIIGGGLAGSEAALQLALRGVRVDLYEMKPEHRSPAHHHPGLAEIVCSNSFGNLKLSTGSGLIKAELRALGCQLIDTAHRLAVPAGNALAVDRETFANTITQTIAQHPLINLICETVSDIPDERYPYVIIATGPLTAPALAQALMKRLNQQHLYFFDAAAPIITKDSINFDVAFVQDRYSLTDPNATEETEAPPGSYINCPLNEAEYTRLMTFIREAERVPMKAFETDDPQAASGKTPFFESCLPIEELAHRGWDTPRYGPLKPVGLLDPRTQQQPWAVVQLRQDNMAGTLYNLVGFQTHLKWGDQRTMIQLIPGLENADIVRYGVMHRNTYLHSPSVLRPTMQLQAFPNILIGGQLTGVEGYTESIASGLMAALTVYQCLHNQPPLTLPDTTMMGALFQYITRPGVKNFQPINSNWGILPPLPGLKTKNKKLKAEALAQRALDDLKTFKAASGQPLGLGLIPQTQEWLQPPEALPLG